MEDSSTGCYDGGLVEISTDDGVTWTQLTPAPETDPYDGSISTGYSNPAGGSSAWCGDPSDWSRTVVMLSSYAGQTIRLRFRMSTDSSVSREGWYIDDVVVKSCVSGPVGTIFNDGFESGGTNSWSFSTMMP